MTSKTPGRAHLYTTSKAEKEKQDNGSSKPQRQQFTACGPCRHRRVKCDLKDVVSANPESLAPQCTNCSERGLNCVDTYKNLKEPKGPKQLRRGKRIAQAEKIFGKDPQAPESSTSASIESSPVVVSVRPLGPLIPKLHPEFFTSPFFRRFNVQRPILEPKEISARYLQSLNGNRPALGEVGELIIKVLAIWAVSYGVDERGNEGPHGGLQAVQERRNLVKRLVDEMLELVDARSILRKPSWDGVRVLLLLMPLTEDVMGSLERLTLYQSAIGQIYILCTQAAGYSEDEIRMRARIFWYGHIHEGITSGLRGRKLLSDEADIVRMRDSILPRGHKNSRALTSSPVPLTWMFKFAIAPTRVATACRKINTSLTGPAAQVRDQIDEELLKQAWENLEQCWEEFEELRVMRPEGLMITDEEVERFVSGWKVFIFECHNVIEETLRRKEVAQSSSTRVVEVDSSSAPCEDPDSNYNRTVRLLNIAQSKCHDRAKDVIDITRKQLQSESFFQYDAALVRDGTYYAAKWAAEEWGNEEDVKTCIEALSKMRWAFSANIERIASLELDLDRCVQRKREGDVKPRMNPQRTELLPEPHPQYPEDINGFPEGQDYDNPLHLASFPQVYNYDKAYDSVPSTAASYRLERNVSIHQSAASHNLYPFHLNNIPAQQFTGFPSDFMEAPDPSTQFAFDASALQIDGTLNPQYPYNQHPSLSELDAFQTPFDDQSNADDWDSANNYPSSSIALSNPYHIADSYVYQSAPSSYPHRQDTYAPYPVWNHDSGSFGIQPGSALDNDLNSNGHQNRHNHNQPP